MGAAAVLLGAGLQHGGTARADFTWCWDDPVISINGKTVSINVGVNGDASTVRSRIAAANITVHVPRGASTAVLSSAHSYFDEPVTFVADQGSGENGEPIDIGVEVRFSTTWVVPAAMSISYPSGTTGDRGHTRGQLEAEFKLR